MENIAMKKRIIFREEKFTIIVHEQNLLENLDSDTFDVLGSSIYFSDKDIGYRCKRLFDDCLDWRSINVFWNFLYPDSQPCNGLSKLSKKI